jgi:GWxTD domain-containing protein
MKGYSTKTLKKFLSMGLLPVALLAQDRIDPSYSLAINFDYARFAHSDSSNYVEMYFACFPPLVTLVRGSDDYRGYVELRLEIQNKQTGEYIFRNRSLLTVAVKDSSHPSYRNTLVTQMGYVVPKGEYTLSVTGIDSLSPRRRDSLAFDLLITEFGVSAGVGVSDLELCTKIVRSDNTTSIFYKNSHEVIPNPTLLFGSANYPVIFHYAELYGLNVADKYIVKTILADANGKPLHENSREKKYGVRDAVEVGTTNVAKLSSGRYRFQLVVLSESFQPLAKTEKSFFIYHPQSALSQATGAQMKETELSGLTAEELDKEFAYLRYHATDPEVKLYSQVTSVDGKREFLATIWALVEQGKMGREPITRQEYLGRVKKANERFRSFNREGWRTDRGRVLILYNDPDEIERKPSTESGKPYEIWHYYQVENGVEFVYVDRTGFGEYILVHSTKRGELRDDTWQRLLQ